MDWMRQALKDLEHAKRSIEIGDYEWSCFAAHQSAEKAVKALYQALGKEVWGHSISRMLQSLSEVRPPRELIERAKRLDRHYFPSRYPNSHPEGAPLDYYTKGDAERSIEDAEEILEFCSESIRNRLRIGNE